MKRAEQADFPKFEEELLGVWDKERTFEKSLELREGQKRFSFYDGPPFANGLPHFGHSLVTSIKDSLGRYKTMRGYYVERRNGWDTHGLPVEFAIEKQFGVSGKKQIEELGIGKFNQACRESVFAFKHDWEEFFKRIGRWTDTEHAYATIDTSYTESVWWVLGQAHRKGLLYRGYKSMPYCPRCETPLSNFELNEGYKDDVPDPSLFPKFELTDEPGTSFLAWTTTPWTLPVNSALSVHPDADYVKVELLDDGDGWTKGEKLILAKERLDVLSLRKAEFKVVDTVKGRQLEGQRYRPLYEFYSDFTPEQKSAVHRMYLDEQVSLEDGTGILHSAPLYGEVDLTLGLEKGLPLLRSAGADGRMVEAMGPFAGMFFKEADPHITADLTQKGKLFAAETFTHTYPFCYRCESPLFYNAVTTWFIKVSAIKDELLATAESINWTPDHIKYGRFGKWLEGARDWAISRNRYWGAPMPIWVNEKDEDDFLVIESLEQLAELAGLKEVPEDLHRPGIDEVVIRKDGKTYRRIEEVFDCWFESGSMPYAQQHYPFENRDVFEESFPADYIGEGLDQTRLWFYVLHVLSTIVTGQPAYKNVLVNGMIMAADGQKLSKRLRNYPPLEDVFSSEGADTLRLYLLGNDQALSADYMRFSRDAMKDIHRNVFMTLWNVYSFLTTYAAAAGWKPDRSLERPVSENVLDRWFLARLDEAVAEITRAADDYLIARAIRVLRDLIEDLSNWYVRRSRRRFKSDDAADQQAAFETLYYGLLRISQLLAPWSPFLSDKLWRGLTEGTDLPESVHLSDWPEVDAGDIDTELLVSMKAARQVVTDGLALRSMSGVKVRQPLAKLVYAGAKLPSELEAIVAEEVNVKLVEQGSELHLDTVLTDELRQEGIMRDLVRLVQEARKQAGLHPGDRIRLGLSTDSAGIRQALAVYDEVLMAETLADELVEAAEGTEAKVNGETVRISVEKL